MDPRELAALLGYTDYADQQVGEAGYTTEPMEAPLPPVGQPPAPPYTPAPEPLIASPTKVGVSVAQDRQGYSSQKMNEIQAGPYGQSKMKQKKRDVGAEIEADYAPIKREMEKTNQAQMDTAEAGGFAEAEAIEARARLQGEVSALQLRHLDDFKRLNEAAALSKQQAKDEYRTRLLAIPEVNPNALWDEAGQFGQFQMATAAFVHDFLGAKGIKTSAMDTINQAIQNKIQAQVHNINTKKEVAAGFRDLYEMTVRESASHEEALAKMQGYMLKSMEAGIDAEMGKYDSKVARLKHQQAKLALRQLQLKNLADIEKQIDQAQDQAYQREIQVRYQDIQASIARAHDKAQIEIAKINAGAKDKNDKYSTPVIYDQSKSGGGAAKWRIKPEYVKDNETVRNVTQKVVTTTKAVDALRELNEIQAKIDGGAAPDLLGRLRRERDRLEAAARQDVVWSLTVDMAGKRASDKDVENIAKLVPAKDWFTNGNNRRVISHLLKGKIQETQLTIGQYTDDIVQGDPAFGAKAAQGKFAEGEAVDAALELNPPPAPESDQLIKEARSPDAMKPIQITGTAKDVEFKQYTLPYWKDYIKSYPQSKTEEPFGGANKIKTPLGTVGQEFDSSNSPPVVFDRLRELAEDAFAGDDRARAELESLRKANVTDMGKNGESIKTMAEYFLEKLDKKPGVPGEQFVRGFGIETE